MIKKVMLLKDKNILVGITGGIAAYKTASLIRLFVKNGARVKVVMTKSAKEFITPLTIATLCQNPILVEFFNPENGEWNSHVSLGEWADIFVIAPTTASTLGKMVNGVADNLLVTTYLSARCQVVIAPAMDLDMYAHITTQNNLLTIKSHGVSIVEPTSGFLASGLEGKGRMAEPEQIYGFVANMLCEEKALLGKKAMITVGGNIEKIDSVRYISNNSSGKMGYAIAKELTRQGAEVTLIRANVNENLIGSAGSAKEIQALSAQEMYDKVSENLVNNDIIIMAAAVSDFTPTVVADHKIKKEENNDTLTITLKKTKDIAAMVGIKKRNDQFFVGFALETDNEECNAKSKLQKKNFDFIVLNSLKDKGAGFATDTNKITIFDKDNQQLSFDLKSKEEVAKDIVNQIIKGIK